MQGSLYLTKSLSWVVPLSPPPLKISAGESHINEDGMDCWILCLTNSMEELSNIRQDRNRSWLNQGTSMMSPIITPFL